MAVKIRLKRTGKTKQPHYRVVVADSRTPRDGRFIEEIGYYNPRTEPVEIRIDLEKAEAWIAKGAQPTDTVRRILKVQKERPVEEPIADVKNENKVKPLVEAKPEPNAEDDEKAKETKEPQEHQETPEVTTEE